MASRESSLRHRTAQQKEPLLTHEEDHTEPKKIITSIFTSKEQFNSLLTLAGLTAVALFTRFYKIYEPNEVVFDEVHFGKFASYYLRGSYFFDVHPPLAKMMLAAMGYFIGYDGHFLFDSIGDSYISNNVPYIGLRALPAFLGAMTVPVVYQTMREAGFPIVTCTLAGLFVTFDNMLVTQTRLILLDSMLVFFMVCSIFSYVKFYKTRNNPFSTKWWTWMVATGFFIGMTTSVKMVGLFTVATVGVAVLWDLWELLDIRRKLTMQEFMNHFWARAVGLIVVPVVVYLFWFYIHFAILTHSGPGDDFMSTEFQETLQGNSMADGIYIKYGDNITIKHKDTSVYLHSHNHQYPLRYDDGRISSAGQQVTGYSHADINNIWQITSDDPNNLKIGEQVNDKDIIRLLHVSTSSWLLAHDVASPTMSTNEEITTYSTNEDGSRINETTFQIILESGGEKLRTMASNFKLLHMDTKVVVWTHSQKLPEWGFDQQEVNGNKNLIQKSNLWLSDSIEGKNATEIEAEANRPVKKRNFFLKFLELQGKMISHNAGLTASHPYQSGPIEWPFLIKGISFWTQNDTRKQIYLIGNPLGMWLAIGSVAVIAGITGADVLSRRRGFYPLNQDVQRRFYNATGFFVVGWILHYFPFFLMGRALFLHHYMPALVFSYMLLAAVHGFIFVEGVDGPISDPGPETRPRRAQRAVVSTEAYVTAAMVALLHVTAFMYFAPLSYGTSAIDVEGLTHRKLLSKWEFHFAK
ncbi:dolichyl-phosphate-mannose-protein mannosyltransferase [Podila verticillata NRRL 6337]|uniref:Dolichyl-phosphate-mannose--protein mannosyltransferase n=1 Tax=Podila verticillata NRRL 6337 TaxID=1069443 RepID=A0A086TLD7_9FUNG|nr:dolichyl-phosphate-mannose-protein mannosyltransferase [Podila verticillata NRRL 6337]